MMKEGHQEVLGDSFWCNSEMEAGWVRSAIKKRRKQCGVNN